jgi:predicted nuclease of predicted toxin-antitoxin system
MVRLYSNENFPLPVVIELRRLGYDVLTIQETGYANHEYPDDEVLAVARDEGRCILTINRKDFIRLHLAQVEHAGIIVCTADRDFIGQAVRIHEAIQREVLLRGKLIRIYRPKI